MALSLRDTVVTYPLGAVRDDATVLHVERLGPVSPFGGKSAVFLDSTPVHPVDAAWPDQGADRARLAWPGGAADLVDAVVAARNGTSLFLGAEIPVRKGTDGWTFLVAHIVEEAPPEGTVVEVRVDADFRHALSLGHTACHLAALALNRALAHRWTKQIPADGLGSPDFDAAANSTSRIAERGSLDTYRLGKSLRKKGFSAEALADELPEIEASVTTTLVAWIASDAGVRIDRDGDSLTDRRYWVCSLPEGELRIPCGGTHATSLGELGRAHTRLTLAEVEGGLELAMATQVCV